MNPDEIFASTGAVPYAWDLATDALSWGANAREVLEVGDTTSIASGGSYARLIEHKDGRSRFDAVMQSGMKDDGSGVPYEVQYALKPTPDSAPLHWIEDSGRWFSGADGTPARAHGIVRVIDARREQEQQLAYLSRYDGLTNEMNRWHMTSVLEATIAEALKLRSSCGFMLAAIDNLGRINEAYGFNIADEVIAAVATRIRSQMRGKDHLGRLSGNKFGLILNNCTLDDMLVAADRLLVGARDHVVQTSAGPVAVTVTIGGVTAPRYARTVAEVLARAQDALDSAKAKRRGSFQAYQPNPERDAQRRENVRATDEIIKALNDRRLFLVYEPVVAIASRQPAFYECLMRVRRDAGSLLAVDDVVPLAERLGLVRLLDNRVLELVLNELAIAPNLRASLNLSAASTVDPDWWASLGAALRSHSGMAERLTVEITETTAIQDIDDAKGFVARVKDLGCRIAIDDFGAGYTSFRNLRKLGVDIVKVDGSFVENLKRSEDDRAFVQTLIDLARRLGLETVAEWVQDEESAAILADWGCDYLQGALVGRASLARPWAHAAPTVQANSA
ncbi:MAG: GGDEF and EAL domain-containing protein [Xanthobacteraceae bacterium]|nr:GGDEF and EAL domain-containing protein [Xanthobacteraceae bacterium]